jgi:hypothetical protein
MNIREFRGVEIPGPGPRRDYGSPPSVFAFANLAIEDNHSDPVLLAVNHIPGEPAMREGCSVDAERFGQSLPQVSESEFLGEPP